MPYLIRTQHDQLLLLNHSIKNGLYSQALSSNGLSRPVIIHRSNTLQYSATVDNNQDLHIITQPSQEQIIHLHYKDNNITRNVILEDPKGIYHFSNLHVIYAKEHVHLFYTANQPIGDSCELIHHILCQENKIETYPILSFAPPHLGFRYMTYNNDIYILYGEVGTHYSLQFLMYKEDNWNTPAPVATSSFPIDDFQFCIDNNGHIHMVYVQEKYGRYHILYKKHQNNVWSDEIILHTTSSSVYPSIFTYHRGIWVNFVDNGNLQMILSMDNGNNFSKSVNCSLKGVEFERCNFACTPGILPSSFNCNMLYASLTSSIRAGIISHIDMIGFHPDIKPNTELELFLDGVFHSLPLKSLPVQTVQPSNTPMDNSPDIIALRTENEELKQIQEQMITQYNDMTELTKKIQDEGKKWRSRAISLESQIEAYQSENVRADSSNTQESQDL